MNLILNKNKVIKISIITIISVLLINYIFDIDIIFFYFIIIVFLLNLLIFNFIIIKDLYNKNKLLSDKLDILEAFKHDFNNIIQSIGGYIFLDNMDGLKSYYNDLTNEVQSTKTLELLDSNIINNPAVFNILNKKYAYAKNHLINFDISVCFDLNSINLSSYNLSRILGILLDNSIEASIECDNKYIKIDFVYDNINNKHIIIIENTYNNDNINTNEIFKKGYSTKKNNSGIGLWKVNQIVNSNKNLKLYTTKTDKIFKQQLEIFN